MKRLIAFASILIGLNASAFDLPSNSTQCLLGLADSWDSSHATLQLFQKSGNQWQPQGEAWKARLGKNGLIWGHGLHPLPKNALIKKEGDMRSPAGVFSIGGAWGFDPSIRKHPLLPYRKVTPQDLWVEDPSSPRYNQHLILNQPPSSAWEKKQQMKQSDPAHALKLYIGHNSPPHTIPGDGSSIFFHIWRAGGAKPTAGCTTMDETKLRQLIARIDPSRNPIYVLLPTSEYTKFRKAWKLP
ncbi:MAG: L,D-transpeptidase family protein [Verrucomicrobia bacterium]|nr:L,D-transpeptidase family protein [Verrucomicrobiota bacterium]